MFNSAWIIVPCLNLTFENFEILAIFIIYGCNLTRSGCNTVSYTHLDVYKRQHHIFTIDDLNDIKKRFENIETENKIILTTEKDAVRLSKFSNEVAELPLYVIPVRHRFLFEEGSKFDALVIDFIHNVKQRP